jgi:hypothetical protein
MIFETAIVFVLILASMGVLAWALTRKGGGGCAGCGGGKSCSLNAPCPEEKQDEENT